MPSAVTRLRSHDWQNGRVVDAMIPKVVPSDPEGLVPQSRRRRPPCRVSPRTSSDRGVGLMGIPMVSPGPPEGCHSGAQGRMVRGRLRCPRDVRVRRPLRRAGPRHPTGRALYVSNRFSDTITTFAVADDGSLSQVQFFSCGGKTPRDFALAPGGAWLVVGNQDSETISVFAVDPDTGRVDEGSLRVHACNTPSCIAF